MADLIMIVDVALAEVPVNIITLIDDTDFKSREVAIAYNAAGMDLVWNFVDVNGNFTQTAVTPTTAGAHDWVHQGDGMYTLEIPASGGTINNDAEGFGWFTGFVTGVLPWRGPVIQFSPANIVNSLVVGSDLLDVSIVQLNGGAQSLTDLKDFADDGYDPATNKVEGVKLADTVTTYTGNTPQTGDNFARIGATGSGLTTLATAAAVAAALADLQSRLSSVVTKTGAVATDGGNSATTFVTNLTESTNDYWKDSFLKITSGALINQVKKITGYNGTTKAVTLASALTGTPADAVTFEIIND